MLNWSFGQHARDVKISVQVVGMIFSARWEIWTTISGGQAQAAVASAALKSLICNADYDEMGAQREPGLDRAMNFTEYSIRAETGVCLRGRMDAAYRVDAGDTGR
jgi:hypothetical protein